MNRGTVVGLALALAVTGGAACKKEADDTVAERNAKEAAQTVGDVTRRAANEVADKTREAAERLGAAGERVVDDVKANRVDPVKTAKPATPAEQQRRTTARNLEGTQQATEHASDQLEQAARAEKRVAEAEKDLREAQAEAQRERTEARQAQENARTTAEAALDRSRTTAEATAPAEAHRVTEPVTAPATPHLTTGRVTTTGAREVVIERPGQSPLNVVVEPTTLVLIEGRPASVRDLATGAAVSVSYRVVADRPVADRIEQTAAAASTGMPTPRPLR